MMYCEQARQLFDAYLNDELSPSQVTELGAHRVQCADCRRELALLEVAGHIVVSDQEESQLAEDFTGRLLSCMCTPPRSFWARYRTRLYVAGPLAAAAVIMLAFLGVFDRERGRKAGVKVKMPAIVRMIENVDQAANPHHGEGVTSSEEQRLKAWFAKTQAALDAKRQSGESLQKALDLTILQLLDILDQSKAPVDIDRNSMRLPSPTTSPEPSHQDVEDM